MLSRSTSPAKAQLARLEAALADWARKPRPKGQEHRGHATTPTQNSEQPRASWSTAIKSLLAIGAALSVGWYPVQRLLATTSAEAIINARLVTIRAPIDGVAGFSGRKIEIGAVLGAGDELLMLVNQTADSAHLDNLARAKNELATSVAALAAKKQILERRQDTLGKQQEAFRQGRIAQLDSRIAEIESSILAARSRHETAAAALQRTSTLKSSGYATDASLERAQQDERVARHELGGLLERRMGTLVELNGARTGTYIGDSYNDTPQSAQRGLEVELELADVSARLVHGRVALDDAERVLGAEIERQAKLAAHPVRSNVSGRVWEVLTSPGELVMRGQELIRVLDCDTANVAASVTEAAYQKLRIGQAAEFKMRGSGRVVSGHIVALNGLAAVNSNAAIAPAALSHAPYHVSLKFPDLSGSDCEIGRSGLVTFKNGLPEAKPAPRL